MTDRAALARAFLDRTDWAVAASAPLAGDASARSYRRLTLPSGTRAVLMDAPPGLTEPVTDFTRIAAHLRGLGLSPPEVLAEDATQGFLLLEDLGDDLYARVLARAPGCQPELYTAATDVLLHLQSAPPAPDLPPYDVPMLAEFTAPFATDYAGTDPTELADAMRAALARLAPGTTAMILRDYHAENLLWLPGRSGLARVGLLDFQQAMLCHPAYDLVSLLQDARRDVDPRIEARMIARFAAATGADPAGFGAAYAALGAQRNLRILGLFARLARQQGKTRYLAFMPRVWGLAQRCLAHPELADLAGIVTKMATPPSPSFLQGFAPPCPAP